MRKGGGGEKGSRAYLGWSCPVGRRERGSVGQLAMVQDRIADSRRRVTWARRTEPQVEAGKRPVAIIAPRGATTARDARCWIAQSRKWPLETWLCLHQTVAARHYARSGEEVGLEFGEVRARKRREKAFNGTQPKKLAVTCI